MSKTKYLSICRDEEGISVFRGKKKVEFELVQMMGSIGENDKKEMRKIEFERLALVNLPEPMTKDEFREFTRGRHITEILSDCLGVDVLEGAEE